MKPAIKTKQYFCKEKKFEMKNCRIIFSIIFLIKTITSIYGDKYHDLP